jgi:hypothetical protein
MSEPLNKLILDKVWMCLSNQPDHCKNAYFNQFLKSSSVVEEIATESKIKSASSLPAYMNGPKPDNIDYFKTLPTECGTDWCCYAAILEKPGCKPRVQIGSGTHGTFGGQRRLDDYPNERALPSLVLKALNEGFVITHVGVLCTASKPEAADQPLTRLVFVAIEGTFAYLFWSLNAYKADYGMGFTCLWDWQGLPWDSLSTHSPFYEGIRSEFGLTEEQMQDHLAKLEIKHKQSRARINSNSHYRRMEENYHECMDATMQQVKEWRAANPERKLENDRALRKKVLDEKRNLCSDCQMPFQTPAHLAKHKKSLYHERMVSGYFTVFCEVCPRGLVSKENLAIHVKSERHKKAVARFDAAADDSDSHDFDDFDEAMFDGIDA